MASSGSSSNVSQRCVIAIQCRKSQRATTVSHRDVGRKAVEEILSLERRRDTLRCRLAQLMEPDAIPDFGHDEWNADIDRLTTSVQNITATIIQRRRQLAIEDQARLHSAQERDFLSDRLSAKALKTRIRSALIHRRNELQRLREGIVSSASGK